MQSLDKYNKKILLIALIWLTTVIIISSIIITFGLYEAVNQASTKSNIEQLSNGNENLKSQLATNISRLIENNEFVEFLNAGDYTRHKLQGKIYEDFINAISSSNGIISGIEVFQHRNAALDTLNKSSERRIFSALNKSKFYFDVKLSYAQGYYDPNSNSKGFIRVFLNKDQYNKVLFKKYVDLKPYLNNTKINYISTIALGKKLGDFSIDINANSNFKIKAQNIISNSANLLVLYGSIAILFLFTGLFFLLLYIYLKIKKDCFDTLGLLHSILIDDVNFQKSFKYTHIKIDEINELYIAGKSLIKMNKMVSKNLSLYKSVLLEQVLTDIHEVKNYMIAMNNRIMTLDISKNILVSLQNSEDRVTSYLNKYKKISSESLEHDIELNKLEFKYISIDKYIKVIHKLIDEKCKIHSDIIINLTACTNLDSSRYVQLSVSEIYIIVSNLLNNAIQSPSLRRKEIEINIIIENNQFICFLISDNGEGFDKARLNQFFNGYSCKKAGTGHGLSQIKKIADNSNSEIKVIESNPCIKTTVSFRTSLIQLSLSDFLLRKINNNELVSIHVFTCSPSKYKKVYEAINNKATKYFHFLILNDINEIKKYKNSFYISPFSLIIIDFVLHEEIKEVLDLYVAYSIFLVTHNEDVTTEFDNVFIINENLVR